MIVISVEDREIREAIERLSGSVENMTPAMRAIGAYLQNATKMRFREQKSPGGESWIPSKRAGRDKKGKGKTLVDTGRLRDSITYLFAEDFAIVGTNVVYAAPMQFGAQKGEFGDGVAHVPQHSRRVGKLATNVRAHDRYIPNIPWGDIPARPFLGISYDDKGEILDLIADYLEKSWNG